MSELDQLKKRIEEAGPDGLKTSIVRDDYEPAGDMFMMSLCEKEEFVQRKGFGGGMDQSWRIFKKEFAPY